MEPETLGQLRGKSEETLEHVRIMYPEGSTIGIVRDLAGWD